MGAMLLDFSSCFKTAHASTLSMYSSASRKIAAQIARPESGLRLQTQRPDGLAAL
jgi:hypothetical protein